MPPPFSCNIDKILDKNANNIFQIENSRNFKTDFFLKPILADISCETSVFKKLLLQGAVFMTFTLNYWSIQCFKFT